MIDTFSNLNRRTVLKAGLGSLALPFLPSLGVCREETEKNLVFFYLPNGVFADSWYNYKMGPNGFSNLSDSLLPLSAWKEHLTIVRGLYQGSAIAGPDGVGDHARAAAAYLTGRRPFKTQGEGLSVGRSIDFEITSRQFTQTRFSNIALTMEDDEFRGACDAAYSCEYSHHISWRNPTTPEPYIYSPQVFFDLLFPQPDQYRRILAKSKSKRSVLDFAGRELTYLKGRVNALDQLKLEEYLDSVRSIEKQLANMPQDPPTTSFSRPASNLDYLTTLNSILDLMILALQSNSTSTLTFMFGSEFSDRLYRHLNLTEGHHALSHHGFVEEKVRQLRLIDRFHIEVVAGFVARLKNADLLTSTLVVAGAGMLHGQYHTFQDLPTILVGGKIRGNREIVTPEYTPIANLWRSIANRMQVPLASFGDSSGAIELS